MSFLYFLLFGLVLLFFLAYILSGRDILSPSVVMVLMFIIGTVFALPNIGTWGIEYNSSAGIITLSGIFVFMCAESLVSISVTHRLSSKEPRIDVFKPYILDNRKLIFLLLFNITIVFWYYLQIRRLVGATDISGLFLAYRRLGISDRGGNEVELVSGPITQFLKIVEGSGYVSGYFFINNLLSKYKKRGTSFLLISLILLSILPGVFSAGRSKMLRLASSFLIEYYILWHQKNGWDKNLSWKMIRIGLGGLLIGIPTFYYSLSLLGRNTTKALFEYTSTYISSGILLFSSYLDNPISKGVWGEESLPNLLKLFDFLGIGQSSTSYNLEFRQLGTGLSNIYSFFRRPYHDFGLLGMYVFVAMIAILFAVIYYGKIKYKPKSFRTSCWILLYGYLFYWIVIAPIDQYSTGYVSVGTVLNMLVIFLLYIFLSEELIRFKKISRF